jgi:3-oxoacyl-[acyl-carrier protein] reductase
VNDFTIVCAPIFDVSENGGVTGDGLTAVASDWEGELRGSVLTAVLLTRALESALRRPGATIVNVSSIAAVNGGGDSYSGKGGHPRLDNRPGRPPRPDGVRANAVVAGYVQGTEFFGDGMTQDRHDLLVARTLLGRAGTPDDVSGCVFFLASDDAAYITGQFLHVNGGAVLGR